MESCRGAGLWHTGRMSETTPGAGRNHGPRADDAERAREILAWHRQSIDNVDAALVHLLAERFKSTKAVGELKAEHGLPAADPTREAEQVARLKQLAHDSGLDPVFAERFLRFIVTEVIRHHEQIAEQQPVPDEPSGE